MTEEFLMYVGYQIKGDNRLLLFFCLLMDLVRVYLDQRILERLFNELAAQYIMIVYQVLVLTSDCN